MAEIILAMKKDEELVKDIQEVFTRRIVPDNFILVIHKYNRNVLTFEDIERIRKMIRSNSTVEVNYDLLLTMKKYKGWFEVILQVCNDPDVKQADLAEAFRTIKGELDERWNKQHTKSKDVPTTLAKVSLTSESNLGAKAMGRQLSANGGLEADSGTVCMPSDTRNQSSLKGFQLKNGKPYCDICCLELTSQKAANDHFNGNPHQKKLKAKSLVSEDVSKTGITTAAISQSTCDGAKSTLASSGATEATVVSPGSNNVFAAASKQASGGDENYIIVNDKGQGECRICKVPVSGGDNAILHLRGSKHQKALKALDLLS